MTSAPETIAFTGVVTKSGPDFGMVRDDVFFVKSVVKGPFPEVGDRVLVQAEKVHGMPFQYVAKRLQRLFKDVTQTSEVAKSSPPPGPTYSTPPPTSSQPNLPKHIVEQFFPVFSSLLGKTTEPVQQPVENSSNLKSEYEAFEASINSQDVVQTGNSFQMDDYNYYNYAYGYTENFPSYDEEQVGVYNPPEHWQPEQQPQQAECSWQSKRYVILEEESDKGYLRNSKRANDDTKKFQGLNGPSKEAPRSRRMERTAAIVHSKDGEKQCFYCDSTEHKARKCPNRPKIDSEKPQRKRETEDRASQRSLAGAVDDSSRISHTDPKGDAPKERASGLQEETFFKGTSMKVAELTKRQKLKLSRLYCNKYGQEQCFICGSIDHKVKKCPKLPESTRKILEQNARMSKEKSIDDHRNTNTKDSKGKERIETSRKERTETSRKERTETSRKEMSGINVAMHPTNSTEMDKPEESPQQSKEPKNKHKELKPLPAKKDPANNEKFIKMNKLLGKRRLRSITAPSSQSSNSKRKADLSPDQDLFCSKCQKMGHIETFCLSERIAKHSKQEEKAASSSSSSQIQTLNKKELSLVDIMNIPLPDTKTTCPDNHPPLKENIFCSKCLKTGHIEKFCLSDRIAKLSAPVEKPVINNSVSVSASLTKSQMQRKWQENSTAFKNSWTALPPKILPPPTEFLVCSKCQKTGHIEKHCIAEQITKIHEKSTCKIPSVIENILEARNKLSSTTSTATPTTSTSSIASNSKDIQSLNQISKNQQEARKVENPAKEAKQLNSVPENKISLTVDVRKSTDYRTLGKPAMKNSPSTSHQNKEKENNPVKPLLNSKGTSCDKIQSTKSNSMTADGLFKIPHPIKNLSPKSVQQNNAKEMQDASKIVAQKSVNITQPETSVSIVKPAINYLKTNSSSVKQSQNFQNELKKLPVASQHIPEKPSISVPQITKNSPEKKNLNTEQKTKPPLENEIIEIPNTIKNNLVNATPMPSSSNELQEYSGKPPQTKSSPSKDNPATVNLQKTSISFGQYQPQASSSKMDKIEMPAYLTKTSEKPGSGYQASYSVTNFNHAGRNDRPGSKFQKLGGRAQRLQSAEFVLIDSPYVTPTARIPPTNESPADFKKRRLETTPQDSSQNERATKKHRTPQGDPVCYKCQKAGHIAKYCSTPNVPPTAMPSVNISTPKSETSNPPEELRWETRNEISRSNDQRKDHKTRNWESEPTTSAPQSKCDGCLARMLGGPSRNHKNTCLLGGHPRFKDNRIRGEDNSWQFERGNEDFYESHFNTQGPLAHEEDQRPHDSRHDLNYEDNFNFRVRNGAGIFNPNSNEWMDNVDSGRRSPVQLVARNKEDIPTAHRQNQKLSRPWRQESHFPDSFDAPVDFHHETPECFDGSERFYEEPQDFHDSFNQRSDFHNERRYHTINTDYRQERVGPPVCSFCHKLGHVADDCRHLIASARRRHVVTL